MTATASDLASYFGSRTRYLPYPLTRYISKVGCQKLNSKTTHLVSLESADTGLCLLELGCFYHLGEAQLTEEGFQQ